MASQIFRWKIWTLYIYIKVVLFQHGRKVNHILHGQLFRVFESSKSIFKEKSYTKQIKRAEGRRMPEFHPFYPALISLMGHWPISRWDISSGATVREEPTQRQHYSTSFLRYEIIPGHHLAAWHTVWEQLSMCNMKRLREFGFKSSSQQGLTTDLPPGGYEITKCFILLILHMNSLNSFPVPPSSPFFPPVYPLNSFACPLTLSPSSTRVSSVDTPSNSPSGPGHLWYSAGLALSCPSARLGVSNVGGLSPWI